MFTVGPARKFKSDAELERYLDYVDEQKYGKKSPVKLSPETKSLLRAAEAEEARRAEAIRNEGRMAKYNAKNPYPAFTKAEIWWSQGHSQQWPSSAI